LRRLPSLWIEGRGRLRIRCVAVAARDCGIAWTEERRLPRRVAAQPAALAVIGTLYSRAPSRAIGVGSPRACSESTYAGGQPAGPSTPVDAASLNGARTSWPRRSSGQRGSRRRHGRTHVRAGAPLLQAAGGRHRRLREGSRWKCSRNGARRRRCVAASAAAVRECSGASAHVLMPPPSPRHRTGPQAPGSYGDRGGLALPRGRGRGDAPGQAAGGRRTSARSGSGSSRGRRRARRCSCAVLGARRREHGRRARVQGGGRQGRPGRQRPQRRRGGRGRADKPVQVQGEAGGRRCGGRHGRGAGHPAARADRRARPAVLHAQECVARWCGHCACRAAGSARSHS